VFVLYQLLAESMTGISSSAKQGSLSSPAFCTSVANLAEAVCGITENAAQVYLEFYMLRYLTHCLTSLLFEITPRMLFFSLSVAQCFNGNF